MIETGKEEERKPMRIHSRLIAETVKTWSMIITENQGQSLDLDRWVFFKAVWIYFFHLAL